MVFVSKDITENTEKIKTIKTIIQENVELKKEIASLRQDIERVEEKTNGLQKEIAKFYQYFLEIRHR